LLSETGLYSDPTVRSYSPQYPLWSDGAEKRRWIALPPGTTIDAADDAAWQFPVGTRLWKEFAFGGRKVETRLLCRTGEGRWVYAAYVWNEQQTEATLAPEGGVPRAAAIAPGKSHSVPSLVDCSACHEAGVGPVLGFDALQLSDDRDPNAPHAEPLEAGMVTDRTLVEEGWLSPRRGDLVERPPAIRASSPLERSVLGYLATNCGTCHNASGPLAGLGLSLAHPADATGAERMLLGTRDVVGLYAIPGLAPGETRRLAPGDPDRSSLVHRMDSRRPASQMPPLGTVLPDTEAVELVRSWIAAVP
jgi:hypothetical protein